MPVIPDEATQVAALRTGVLDISTRVAMRYKDSLAATNPELLTALSTTGETAALVLKCDREPFSNEKVRQAVMIGMDREALMRAVYPGSLTYQFPVDSALPGHIPLDELPAETRVLFDYNPDLARQMLAEADYPGGFKVNIAMK